MRSCALLAVIVFLGAACTTTTTVGSMSDPTARRWLGEKAPADMKVETNDSRPALDDVRIEAISPTDIRFHARSGEVVPTDRVRRVTVRNHALGGIEGMAIGAAGGVVFGVLLGLAGGRGSTGCDICSSPSETAIVGALVFGVPALVIGLVGGAIRGHQVVLELK